MYFCGSHTDQCDSVACVCVCFVCVCVLWLKSCCVVVVFPQAELESIALSDILEFNFALDTGALNSLLTVSVKSQKKPTTTVFVFQCEDVRVRTDPETWFKTNKTNKQKARMKEFLTSLCVLLLFCLQADFIQKDLTRALIRWKEDPRSRYKPEACEDVKHNLDFKTSLLIPSYIL